VAQSGHHDHRSQGPDAAIHLYHFWDVAHRIRRDPLAQYTPAQAMEKVEEEEEAFLNLQCVRAATELGKALQLQAWAIYHGGAELVLKNRRDLIGPHDFDKVLGDFIAADKEHSAIGAEDEPARDAVYERRSNALFSLFAANPKTVGQAREILQACVFEIRECELTVGGRHDRQETRGSD
jgi:hypothetical protein